MASMRTASVHDLPGTYRVCRLTGLAGRDATAWHADPDLLGHLWVGPYLIHPDAVALVIQDDSGVAGYCVGAPDTRAFEDWCERVWWPPLRARYPAGSGTTDGDAAAVRLLHTGMRTETAVLQRYPAHLHINLLPRLQGQGWGRRLVDELGRRLSAAGAAGVHLGVDRGNEDAARFYERLGFTELPEPDDDGGRLYGMALPRGERPASAELAATPQRRPSRQVPPDADGHT